MRGLVDATLRQRGQAAWKLAYDGEVDGPLALSYVLWPRGEDIPHTTDRSIKARLDEAVRLARRCSARHGKIRCDAEADPDIGLCENHLWAFVSGEDFDFWGER